MKVVCTRDFEPWSGGQHLWNAAKENNVLDLLEAVLESRFAASNDSDAAPDETGVNDLLWFEPEYLAAQVLEYAESACRERLPDVRKAFANYLPNVDPEPDDEEDET